MNQNNTNVKDHWNALEQIIIDSIDEVAPLKQFKVNPTSKSKNVPICIKQKLNKRNRLLKHRNCPLIAPQIKNLNKDIRDYFVGKKASNIKQALTGNKVNLWKAVNNVNM